MRRAAVIGGLVLGVGALAIWFFGRSEIPHAALSREGEPSASSRQEASERSATDDQRGEQVRRLAAENFALLQERAALKKALLSAGVPVVTGLPTAAPPLYSAEESRILDDVFQRVFTDVGPKLQQLYREAKGAPPPDATPAALFGALLDDAAISDVKALLDHIAAVKKLKEQDTPPGRDAPLAQRVLWLLSEAGDAVEREVKEALPPDRYDELSKLPKSGFGYSVRQENGHWVVAQARPHA